MRLALATPYFATSASRPSITDGCALSASISTASRRCSSSPSALPLLCLDFIAWFLAKVDAAHASGRLPDPGGDHRARDRFRHADAVHARRQDATGITRAFTRREQ